MSKIEGVFVAMVTPMHEDEAINFVELANQVRRQRDAGVDWIFCLGTNGEFYSLSHDEKLQVMEAVVSAANDSIKVCAGVGCITTAETKILAKKAEELGVQAVSVITPYFVSVSQDQLAEHFREAASEVRIPLILYNIPGRTGNSIEPRIIAELEAQENIVAIKDSSGDLDTVKQYIDAARGLSREFSVLVGTDSLIHSGLELGATGCVSGLANVTPEIVIAIYRHCKNGETADAAAAQEALNDIRSMLSLGNSNTIAKRATVLAGHPVGPARKPVGDVSADIDVRIQHLLANHQR